MDFLLGGSTSNTGCTRQWHNTTSPMPSFISLIRARHAFPMPSTPRPRIGKAGSPSGWCAADKACYRGMGLDALTRPDARRLSMLSKSESEKTITHYSFGTKLRRSSIAKGISQQILESNSFNEQG